MTTDFKNELRELFREKAGEAPLATPGTPASAPPQVLRRGRRRQVATVVGAAAVVALVAVGSIAGIQGLLGRGPEPVPTGQYDVFQRTATVEAFTVTSPSDWYLVNDWPLSLQIPVQVESGSAGFGCEVALPGGGVQECQDTPQECPDTSSSGSGAPVCYVSPGDENAVQVPPHGLPMIQLTNIDLGLDANACRDGIPDDGAALYVALDLRSSIDDPSIPPFPPGQGLPPEGDGECGPGRYAHFAVNGEPFFAWIGLGPDVTAENREIVETAYEQMSAIPDWTPQPPDQLTPGYVFAGGVTDSGDQWRLEARPGQDVTITSVASSASSDFEFALGDRPVTWCCPASTNMGEESPVIFGTVQLGADGVEFHPDGGGAAIQGTIVPTPPSLGTGFDLFFLEGTEGLTGNVVAVGLGTGEAVSPSVPPTEEPRSDTVELTGSRGSHEWSARFSGAFDDASACITVTVDGTEGRNEASCGGADVATSWSGNQPYFGLWLFDGVAMNASSVPAEVEGIRFTSDDTTRPVVEGSCVTGPIGWTDHDVCAIALPAEDEGTFEYLDGNGRVLFVEQGSAWGSSSAAPPVPNVSPVHGGTYWAVYPWVGSPGDPGADQVSAALAEEYGIEAFASDLSCDEGAAEVLGTDSQGVGVYFETREDAEAFANQLVGGIATEAPVVQVTTYCLD